MYQNKPRRGRTVAAVIAASFAVGFLALPIPAMANPTDPERLSALPPDQIANIPTDSKIADSLTNADGVATVFVQFALPAVMDKVTSPEAARKNRSGVTAIEKPINKTAKEVTAKVEGSLQYTTTNVLAGAAITADAAKLRALAERGDVVSIKPIIEKSPTNSGADALTNVTKSWASTGALGKGVRIAIIDSGVDYTHADFGGPGTVPAYNAAKTSVTPPYPSGTKFSGGYDLAGDAYTGNSTPPIPDANPLDCESGGHGTHVAGTAAGIGVNADGTPFVGDYKTLTESELEAMRIGPGSAPEATIVPYRVFGCSGVTGLTAKALDRAWADGVDVVNMSLGSKFSYAEDPEYDLVEKMSASGTVFVISSGNGGDVTDTGGSPGSSRSALTVANSVDNFFTSDGIEITDPASPATPTILTGQYSGFSNWTATLPSVAGGAEVVSLDQTTNLDGCRALNAADAAKVAGKIAYLDWDDRDATRRCGSGARWGNVIAAGGVGVVIPTEDPFFTAGIAGDPAIPGIQLDMASATLFAPIVDSGATVRFGPDLMGNQPHTEPATTDMLNPSSSRGVHGSLGIHKPDVAAPGTQIFSAGVASGDQGANMSGTSMSSPHVAGIAATMVEKHKDWTPAQVKAAIMNTATHDVYEAVNKGGLVHGPGRVGAGRVDAQQATDVGVLAYDSAVPELVTAAFGVVEVGAAAIKSDRKVTVQNTTANAVTLGTEFNYTTPVEGVTYSVAPATLTIPGGQSSEVTVTLAVTDPTALRKTMDATMSPIGAANELPRDYVPAAEGRLILKPVDPATVGVPADGLRVPVAAVVRPVAEMNAAGPVLFADDSASEAGLMLEGRGLTQGPQGTPSSYNSLVAPFELAATSPKLPAPIKTPPGVIAAGDLSHVGISSTVPQIPASASDADFEDHSLVSFGLSAYGDLSAPGAIIIPLVLIDTNKDGIEDYIVRTYRLDSANVDDDTMVSLTYNAITGIITGVEPLNGLFATTDTNIFDTSVIVLPSSLESLGFTGAQIRSGQAAFDYEVVTLSPYMEGGTTVVDQVSGLSYDPTIPGVWFGDIGTTGVLYPDLPGLLPMHRTSPAEKSLLLLHLHNGSGKKAEVVTVATLGAAAITVNPTTVERGGKVTIEGSGFTPRETVEFELHSTPVSLGNAKVKSDGTVSAEVTIPADTAAGAHTVVAKVGPVQASTPLTVTATAKPGGGNGTAPNVGQNGIAVTGAHIFGLIILALVLSGAGAVLVTRRRNRVTG